MDVGAVCRRTDHRRDGHRPLRSGRRAACSCLARCILVQGEPAAYPPHAASRPQRAAAGRGPACRASLDASPALSPQPPRPRGLPAAGASAPGRAVRRARPAGRQGGGRRRESNGRRACLVSAEWCHSRLGLASTRACCCSDHAPPPAAAVEPAAAAWHTSTEVDRRARVTSVTDLNT